MKILGVVLAVTAIIPPVVGAQSPPGSDTISLPAVAESLKVLDQLRHVTATDKKNAAAWFHRGMIAFVLAERSRAAHDTIRTLDQRALRIDAGDSFRAALNIDSRNQRYMHAAQQFYLTDRTGIGRAAGRPTGCDTRVLSDTAPRDSAFRVQRIHDMGIVCWVDYDGYENRALSSYQDEDNIDADGNITKAKSGPPPDAATTNLQLSATIPIPFSHEVILPSALPIHSVMQAATDTVVGTLKPVAFEVAGEASYLGAHELFRAAYALAPTNADTYRDYAMLLAARNNWAELATLSRDYTGRMPSDGWGWMTLALANYRLRPSKDARPMFDSAIARLDRADQHRLDRFERVLKPADSAWYVRQDSARRTTLAASEWLLADPLWSAPHADPRTEFLARVTYAELRWSLPGAHLHGADTDRGDIYIRYGPPDNVLGYAPPGNVMHTFWLYKSGLIFEFDKGLHTGAANIPQIDLDIVDRVKDWQPSRWDNIASERIDSMPTQLVRFRAGTDSVDVFLATHAPVDTMRKFSVGNVSPRANLWLYANNFPDAFLDSVNVGQSGMLQWTRRVRAGPYYYRVESMIPGTLIAARAAARVMLGADTAGGFALRGFGLSDILLAKTATSGTLARRWSDFDIVPMLGNIRKGSEISLVWETYDLGHENTSAHYDVAIAIERQRSKSGRIAAQIVGRVASAVGVTTSANKMSMRFERAVPYSGSLTDNVSINLGATPPGTYRLTVQVSDRVTKRVSSRAITLVIDDAP